MNGLNVITNAHGNSLSFNDQETLIPKMQILRYMGNKRGLLFWLIPQIMRYVKAGDTILDLFAGTSSVGYALKPNFRIIANDIQSYSYEISRALLIFNGKVSDEEIETNLMRSYQKNYKYLYHIYEDVLNKESFFIKNANCSKYFVFSSTIPVYGKFVNKDLYKIAKYVTDRSIEEKRNAIKSFPYNLFTTYYPCTFFSLQQCIEIDSIRYSIDQISNSVKKSVYLSCLLFAISKTVNSSGHFAEYFRPNSLNTQKTILKQRSESISKHFFTKLYEFDSIYRQRNWKNKVYNHDYKELINRIRKHGDLHNIKLIYIDPPYTSAQYSRFYHIPETLIKYDYPKMSLNTVTKSAVEGKYRIDRHQSPFSQITHAKAAFEEMFKLLSLSCKATLAISYSDNSLIQPIDNLIDLAGKYYLVTNVSNGYLHSAQGSRFRLNGKGNKKIHEHLLICKPK